MNEIFSKIKNGLIVSCQAEEGDPFNSPESILLFAKAAVLGGALGIRSRGFENTKLICDSLNVPVIGLTKSYFDDGYVRITGSFKEVEEIVASGCQIIAIDGTFRLRENLSGPDFISEVKKRFNVLIMADIAEFSEAEACFNAGADCISTTLSGYTPNTLNVNKFLPDYDLLSECLKLDVPVIAEGRINSPDFAAEMILRGAFAVVVGTAITRPRVVTGWFVDKIKETLTEEK